jgi:DNA-directed RNA polymerase specialized sigma subunit
MPKINEGEKTIIEMLQKILIVELYYRDIGQNEIARIVGVASTKVGSIVKYLNKKKGK